jgi:hypothetical protein
MTHGGVALMRVTAVWFRGMACILLLCLAACTGVRTEYLDSGAKAYLVSCKGVLKSWESCLVKAGRICRSRGYDTIRSDEDDGALLVTCRPPPGEPAARR